MAPEFNRRNENSSQGAIRKKNRKRDEAAENTARWSRKQKAQPRMDTNQHQFKPRMNLMDTDAEEKEDGMLGV